MGSTRRTKRRLSAETHTHHVIALVGEAGCGKTTLGKVAVGHQRPTGGSVKHHRNRILEIRDGTADTDIAFEEICRSLQIIHLDPGAAMNPYRSVLDSLAVPLKR